MTKVEIEIDKDGEVTVETSGFNGKGCKDITNIVIAAVAGEVKKETLKPEFYSKAKNKLTS